MVDWISVNLQYYHLAWFSELTDLVEHDVEAQTKGEDEEEIPEEKEEEGLQHLNKQVGKLMLQN